MPPGLAWHTPVPDFLLIVLVSGRDSSGVRGALWDPLSTLRTRLAIQPALHHGRACPGACWRGQATVCQVSSSPGSRLAKILVDGILTCLLVLTMLQAI